MLRMEIALIIILGFIAYMYYSAERKHTKLHRTFSILLLVVIVHLVFDAVTIYTVNHLEQVPLVVNDAFHRVFVGTMAGVLYLFYRYIAAVVEEETKKKMIFDWPAKIFLIVLEIIALVFPNFILQPLVENSLLHGLKNKGYRGEIVITAKKEGNAIEILIRDSGSGFTDGRKDIIDEMLLHYDKKQAKLEGNSIGILNVQKRIKLLCGPKYGLSYMENETGGVTARLLLPHEEDAK